VPGNVAVAASVAGHVTTGLVIVVAAVVVALGLGGYRALSDGRFRGTRALPVSPFSDEPPVASVLSGTPYDGQLGERATLLQFSSAFCAPCRTTRRVLDDVARIVPGVSHVEVDAEQHLELVRRLGVLRTPTTLVLDEHGREVSRAAGAPTKQAAIASLGWLA
jgi:thiol-disulfide isomerase/thioredoxin